jgi:RNA polymerase-binding transcription factor DksA
MADEADVANDYINNQISQALDSIRQNMTKKPGTKTCTECGEAIPEARRLLGFRLCIQCAEETERRKSLFADH